MRISYKIKLSQLYPITGLLHLHLSVKVFQHFCFKISSIVLKYILFSSTEAQKTHQITASASILLPILMPKISISGIPIIANIIQVHSLLCSHRRKKGLVSLIYGLYQSQSEPARATQNHPELGKSHPTQESPRASQSQPERSQVRANGNLI